ncbi:MAG: hypothetical protein LBH82_04670 [Bacteroidales bacterium]|jgi:acyl-ACP thioesterase|nr:hypothetical protein [Bacteroidales bacterium]
MENLHIDNYTVSSYHADFSQKMSPIALFCFLQESAWRHADSKGFGWRHLAEKQQFWVLAKVHAIIHRMPNWTEEIRLETWGKQPELLTAFRDFELFDHDNKTVISATSSWHILDMLSHRPTATKDFADRFPIIDRYAIDKKPEKISIPATDAIQGNVFAVKPSDIDMNQHVNNTRYVQWAMDEIPFDFQKTHRLSEIDVNFVKEAMIENHCYIKTYQQDTLFTQVIFDTNEDKILSMVKSKWAEITDNEQ